jgi:hypothetical protein
MNAWANFIAYQLVWFAVVWSAGHQRAWIGLCAALAFIACQVALSKRRLLDAKLMAAALLCGVLIDGSLSYVGWASYASGSPALPPGGAPLWILALWVSFSLTLTRSLAWLMRRPWLGLLFGALGAPLAYLSAARGFDAVAFAAPKAASIAALALGWAAAIPALAYIERQGNGAHALASVGVDKTLRSTP